MYHDAAVMFTLLVAVACATETEVPGGKMLDKVIETHCELMNTSTIEICCQGRLIPKPPNAACCGTEAYNNKTHLCCAGNVMERLEFHECCGTKFHTTKWFRCCDGHVVRKVGTNACCGRHGYHTDFDICCDGKVYLKLLHACAVDDGEKPEQ